MDSSVADLGEVRAGVAASRRFARLSDVTGEAMPPQRPELVEGVLRRGHKMLVSGPPKAGKTWLAIQLAYAVANGARWLGHRCRKGEVCLVDGEMDPASFYHRCHAVARAMLSEELGAAPTRAQVAAYGEGIRVLHLRGDMDTDVVRLLGLLRAEYGEEPPALVVIDPIYKLLTGDENSNTEMRDFVKGLDAIAAWGPSVATTHHHAKGRAGERSVIDRAAGAGTFGRDPDAVVDLTPLEVREGSSEWCVLRNEFPRLDGEGEAEWDERLRSKAVLRANLVLREFPAARGREFVFDWPLMREVGGMASVPEQGSAEAARAKGARANSEAADGRWDLLDLLVQEAVEACEAKRVTPTRKAVWAELGPVCEADGEVSRPSLKTFTEATKEGGRSAWKVAPEAPYALVRRTAGRGGDNL